MSLRWVGQDDFAVGTLLGVAQDQLPGVGVEQALNGLFDDDGDIVRRGKVTHLGAAAAPAALTFDWSGYLGSKYVELVATAAKMYAVDAAGAFTDLGAPGLAEPVLPAVVGDLIFLPNGFVWGGSTKATYNAGTIQMTAGSPVVTGAATAWAAANVEPGMLFFRTGGTRWYQVKSVDSATQITLTEPAQNNVPAGTGYQIARSATNALPATTSTRHLGTVANRLVIATDNVVAFSPSGAPFTFNATDFHKLPDGVSVVGVSAIRDQLLLFTNFGLWAVANMAFDLTDDYGNPQQQLSRLTPEISLLHEAGLADWAGTIVAPCIDRVFVIDGVSPPVSISDSIASLYMSYLRQGWRPGGAKVFRNHYWLPMLDGAREPQALLLCRLNRPVRSRQLYYPWSQWDGYPTGLAALDVDLRTNPVLRGVHKDGNRVDLTTSLPPFSGTSVVLDPDGNAPIFDVQTRDFPTGNGQPNHVRKLRLFYEAQGDGEIKAAYSYASSLQRYSDLVNTGRNYTQVEADYPSYDALAAGISVAPEDLEWGAGRRRWIALDEQEVVIPGVDPTLWNLEAAERPRFIRARFRSTDGIAQIKIRRIEFAVRPATHER